MTDHKRLFQESEASMLSASGVSLAGIFLIFSRSEIDRNLELALVFFSAAIPLLVGLALLASAIHQEDSNHDKWWESLEKNELYIMSSLLPYLAIAIGIGLVINHVSKVAMYAYAACSVFSLILLVNIYDKDKFNKVEDDQENT